MLLFNLLQVDVYAKKIYQKKIYSQATMEDNFTGDRVLTVLNNVDVVYDSDGNNVFGEL